MEEVKNRGRGNWYFEEFEQLTKKIEKEGPPVTGILGNLGNLDTKVGERSKQRTW